VPAPATIPAELDGPLLRRVLLDRLRDLAADVDRRRQDEGFRAALDAMGRFWRYSPFNQFLIVLQQPDATRVAGRRAWESLGRRVKDDARPIGVLAPTSWKRGCGFIAVPFYDIRQTRGRRVPRLDLANPGASRHVATLEAAAARLGIQVEYRRLPVGLAGESIGGTVRIRSALSGREKVAVLAHELAHEVLHQAELSRAAKAKRAPPQRSHAEVETEADATAYVILGVLGLPSKAPTYIAWQGGTGAQVLRSMNRVQRAARAILEASGLDVVNSRPPGRTATSRAA
jgi:hypothetical protein